MNFDYANVQSSDYGGITGQSLDTPTAWALKNRQGYTSASRYLSNSSRQVNFMAGTNSSPKSYATLTGGKPMQTQSYASATTQPQKVRFETTSSPDYMGFTDAYTPDSSSNLNYYQNSPSSNLSMVSKSISQTAMKGSTRTQSPLEASYEGLPVQCISLNDGEAYDQCIKNDCDMNSMMTCIGEGDCTCLTYDENDMCTSVDKPEMVKKSSDQCFADYSTEYQPLTVAKQKKMMASMMKK